MLKKQMFAKLLALCLVVAMLPVSAVAANSRTCYSNDGYMFFECEMPDPTLAQKDGYHRPVSRPSTSTGSSTGSSTASTPAESVAEPQAESVEESPLEASDGTVEVQAATRGTAASASLSASELSAAMAGASTLTIDVRASASTTSVEVTVPAAALEEAAEKDVNVCIKSVVATITMSSADAAAIAGDATSVVISAARDGEYLDIAITADGNAVTEVNNGLSVEVPAEDYTEAYSVAEDGSETAVEDASAADGVLQMILHTTGRVRLA